MKSEFPKSVGARLGARTPLSTPRSDAACQAGIGMVDDLVEAEPVRELTLKGFHRPVAAYNIVRLKH